MRLVADDDPQRDLGQALPRRDDVASVSRATTSADRLPADPPETNTPPAEAGMPAMSARVRSTWFSAITAPAASNHEMPCSDAADTTMSNSSDALVGAEGMKVNIRGLSADSTVRARWLA